MRLWGRMLTSTEVSSWTLQTFHCTRVHRDFRPSDNMFVSILQLKLSRYGLFTVNRYLKAQCRYAAIVGCCLLNGLYWFNAFPVLLTTQSILQARIHALCSSHLLIKSDNHSHELSHTEGKAIESNLFSSSTRTLRHVDFRSPGSNNGPSD